MEFKILEAVTYVDCAKSVRVSLMIKVVSRPHERSNHYFIHLSTHLKSPAALWLVFARRLKEACVKWRSWKVKLFALAFILHIPEMQVVT